MLLSMHGIMHTAWRWMVAKSVNRQRACPHLVLDLLVSPHGQQRFDHSQVAVDARQQQRWAAILYGKCGKGGVGRKVLQHRPA